MVHHLFIYGTLRNPMIRSRITGRDIPVFKKASISGFKLSSIKLDESIYPILIEDPGSNEIIDGEVIEITDFEIRKMDDYEGSDYRRIKVLLKDNTTAWTYSK